MLDENIKNFNLKKSSSFTVKRFYNENKKFKNNYKK